MEDYRSQLAMPDHFDEFKDRWREIYREMFASEEIPLKSKIVDVTHEFLVPLSNIEAWVGFIQDGQMPIDPRSGTEFTLVEIVRVIQKYIERQKWMINTIRWDIWDDNTTTDTNKQE